MIDLLRGPVEGNDSKALVIHVQDQILALLKSSALNARDPICCWTYHDGEANETDITAVDDKSVRHLKERLSMRYT